MKPLPPGLRLPSLRGPTSLAALALAAAACLGTIGDPPGEGAGSAPGPGSTSHTEPEGFEPAAPALPRLTATQYRRALVDLLGSNLPPTPVEPDTKPHLFYAIGASTTTLSELGTQLYEQAADAVTHSVFDDPARRAALVGCEPQAPGDACVSDFLARFGRRALRRPLTAEEQQRWLKIATDLADPGPWEGLRLAVAGLLQSPHFLYRVEIGEPDPANPGRNRLTGYEMASRLSFLLWDTTPDDDLLDAAERGDLDTPEGIAAEAARLLDDERARAALQSFFAQYLDLGRLDGVTRDPANYPLFTPGMTAAMRKEVELLVDDVVFQGGDARSIFSTHRTFVNADLAALYGVAAPGADAATFVPVELDSKGARAGILTLGAFLTMNAHETRTSPTARGKYVRERVLCQTVPPPPPDVKTELSPPTEGGLKTVREQLQEHRKNPTCAGCHAFIDPPGFLFEGFDSIGATRTAEPNGLPIDSSGDLDGAPLADARDLAAMLKDDPRVGRCMVTQLFRHARARLEAKGEERAIDDIDSRFAAAHYDFKTLSLEMVTHDGFRFVAAVPEEP